MRSLILAAFACLNASLALAQPIVKRDYIPGGVAKQLDCTIQVDFGTPDVGPDIAAWEVVRDYVVASKQIDEANAWGWGRDAQFTLCLRVDDPALAKGVAADITKLVPVKDETKMVTRIRATP